MATNTSVVLATLLAVWLATRHLGWPVTSVAPPSASFLLLLLPTTRYASRFFPLLLFGAGALAFDTAGHAVRLYGAYRAVAALRTLAFAAAALLSLAPLARLLRDNTPVSTRRWARFAPACVPAAVFPADVPALRLLGAAGVAASAAAFVWSRRVHAKGQRVM
jgi:hypothetical protein